MSHPSIDHSILSPSGRVSKRARKAALAREASRLFPPGTFDSTKTGDQLRREKIASLRRSAQELRQLAARGMGPRRHVKAAEALEAQAHAMERYL